MLINQLYSSVSQQDPIQAHLLAFRKCAADLPQLMKPEVWGLVQHEPYCGECDEGRFQSALWPSWATQAPGQTLSVES